MSTLTGLIGGGGGGFPAPTSSTFENSNATSTYVNTHNTLTYQHGTRSAGTFTILSLNGEGWLWYLKHFGATGNFARGAHPKIVVDGTDIISQNSTSAGHNQGAGVVMVGQQSIDNVTADFQCPAWIPFKTSLSLQIIVRGSITSGETFSEAGWCLK
jgi:hypothetical protein